MLFVLLVVVMGFIHPGYSHLTNFISDLGALDAPMPYAQRLNFFQFGIGITALAWALYMGSRFSRDHAAQPRGHPSLLHDHAGPTRGRLEISEK
jgi:hypothetical membrane protein